MNLYFAGLARKIALFVLAAAAAASFQVSAAPAEVRWGQWKSTEVGEKMMMELKAAFEKENPDITLTLVDSHLAELARRLGWHMPQVDRLLDLHHASRLDQAEAALNALGRRLEVSVA